eukprot:COSAG01_NODE_29351_length_639_cov_20.198148_1_plen_50_part_10
MHAKSRLPAACAAAPQAAGDQENDSKFSVISFCTGQGLPRRRELSRWNER